MNKNVKKILIVIFVLIAVIMVYFLKRNNQVKDSFKVDTQEQIDSKLSNGLITMINFSSNTCPACLSMQTDFENIYKQYKDKANIIEVNVDNNDKIAEKYAIKYTPTQIFYDTNGKAVYRHEGAISKNDMETQLNKLGEI